MVVSLRDKYLRACGLQRLRRRAITFFDCLDSMSSDVLKTVLLVEDSDGLRRVYQKLLEAYRYRVLTAEHGVAALEVLARNEVDVVVSDIGMPVMDGFGLARQLRSNPLYRRMRLVALTAYSQPSLVSEARRSGFDAYLTKPINMSDLYQAIEGQSVRSDYLAESTEQNKQNSSPNAAKTHGSFRERLKSATRDVHQEIEDGLKLMRADFNMRDYRQLLERMYGYYKPIEIELSRMAAHQSWSSEVLPRFKTSALRNDLDWLGVKKADIEKLPEAYDLPQVHDLPEILGIMYVLEGATLGGKVLSKHFQNRWGLNYRAGASFFNFYGVRVTDNWHRFLDWMELNINPEDESRTIAAARSTFTTMSDWLRHAGRKQPTDTTSRSTNERSSRSHNM